METSASVADGISVFIPSPTTFATITTKPAGAAMTDLPAAWESSIVDYYLTNTGFLWSEPTTTPAIDSSSSNNTSTHKLSPWVASVIAVAGSLLLMIIFVLLIKRCVRKIMKAEYAETIKTEPGLSWEVFEERCKVRAREAERREEEEERESMRRWRERRAAKKAKGKGKRKGKVTDGDILLHSMEGRHHDQESGRSDFDDSLPPPYSSIVEPGNDIGVVGVAR
jgi:hypothetical protein